jgi:rRNA maturation endonuclease Nob1
MIRISLGNVGSGKTANEIRELFFDRSNKITYTNIETSLKNCKLLTPDMIVTKVNEDKKINYEVNIDFWKKAKKPLNICIDEAHNLIDSRNSMSKLSRAILNWQSSIRRVLGEDDGNIGELIYITQILDSLDIRTRTLCTQFRYHICYYQKQCKKCFFLWSENSEMPEKKQSCPRCGEFTLRKFNHKILVYRFASIDKYNAWRLFGEKTYYARNLIQDIEKISFPRYKTLQWDNLWKGY